FARRILLIKYFLTFSLNNHIKYDITSQANIKKDSECSESLPKSAVGWHRLTGRGKELCVVPTLYMFGEGGDKLNKTANIFLKNLKFFSEDKYGKG
ncbi:MAG: hypothetical protein J6W76_06595, partial [Spirochaetales bacterium]|nr:hypothetical protein [Spirochaetales bacterium]